MTTQPVCTRIVPWISKTLIHASNVKPVGRAQPLWELINYIITLIIFISFAFISLQKTHILFYLYLTLKETVIITINYATPTDCHTHRHPHPRPPPTHGLTDYGQEQEQARYLRLQTPKWHPVQKTELSVLPHMSSVFVLYLTRTAHSAQLQPLQRLPPYPILSVPTKALTS